MLLYFAIGLLSRALHNEKQIRAFAVLFFVFMFLFSYSFNKDMGIGAILLGSLLKSVMIYVWLFILKQTDDTIFSWLIVLIGGVFLLSYF